MILYKTTIIAITSNMCTKYPVLIPGITPNIPKSHTAIQMTATNHNILLITVNFLIIQLLSAYFMPFFYAKLIN